MTGYVSLATRSSLDDQETYWRNVLSSDQAPIKLPFDFPRPPVQTFMHESETITLDHRLLAGLQEVSTQHAVSLFASLLATFNVLLMRFSGQDQIRVGTVSVDSLAVADGHDRREGINPVVLQCDLSGDPTSDELIRRVAQTIEEAACHRDYPFDRLVKAMGLNAPSNCAPFFQVMLVLCDVETSLSDRPCTSRDVQTARLYLARCDMALVVSQADAGLNVRCEYDAELFEAQTIRRILAHFRVLVESLVSTPEQKISTLSMLTPAERHELLVQRDATAADQWHDQTLHRLFEAQAARTPDAIALTFQGEHLSYAELNAQSNRLAHGIIDQGVAPGQSVALMLPTSPLQIALLLAVLKTGCSFVCLDPEYPTERLKLILDEVQPPLLIADAAALATHDGETQQLSAAGQCRIVIVNQLCTNLSSDTTPLTTNLSIDVGPAALAYIVYTSGSTGRPKGIMQSHGSFAQFTAWFGTYFEFRVGSRLAQWASITYDASYCEIFGALCFGATLCLASPATRFDPSLLLPWVADEAITMLQVVPSFAKQILGVIEDEAIQAHPFPQLTQLLLAGEVLSPMLARTWLQRFPDHPKLFNLYGPTECVLATYYPVTDVPLEQHSIPVGQAIDGRQILILDQHGQLCPTGIEGEIYVRSRFLTKGYFQRPDETAATFLQNPLHNEYPDPVYRTRDLGRWLPSGAVEFFGRADNLVKLHGMRVELEEIESVLSSHEAVRECVVTYRGNDCAEDTAGEPTPGLAAYVVLRPRYGSQATMSHGIITSLKDHVLSRLPEYMLPAAIVFLKQLPRTPNGKVDRKALPAPSLPARDEHWVAPRTPTEQILADIWAGVLALDRVGADDNFFALGGHSLLATQVISRVRTVFQIELPFRALFKTPKLSNLAKQIEQARATAEQLLPIAPTSRSDKLPLSFAQQRLWILDQLSPINSAYNILSLTRLQGQLNIAALESSLNEIMRRHEVLRTTFKMVDEQPIQVIASDLTLCLPVIDLTHLPSAEAETEACRIAEEEASRCFDLASGPLIRASLIQLAKNEQIFYLAVHHIVSDEWSMGLLLKELGTLYEAFSLNLPSPLAELPIQYADFAVWQRQWLTGDVLKEQLSYWKQQLENSPPVLALPTDYPRSHTPHIRGRSCCFELSAPLTASLRALGRHENATLFMTLLAGFKTLLYRATNQSDIVVGSPIANRNRSEIEPLIGFFVNMLALRTQVSGSMTFRKVLAQVRETCLGAYAHQDLPFEKLVAELRTERSSSHTPLFQVLCVLQNASRGSLELTGMTTTSYPVSFSTAKFDLNLYFSERDNQLLGIMEYNTDLFKAETVEQLVAQLQRLLEEITVNPDSPLTSYLAHMEAFTE